MQRFLMLLVVGIALGCGVARARKVTELSERDRLALEQGLELYDLSVDPKPEGKTIGRVYIRTLSVFEDREGVVPFFNYLHVTTRREVVLREVLLEPGQLYDAGLIDDSINNLIGFGPRSISLIFPVRGPETPSESVDLLVVTRDRWSFRFQIDFEVASRDQSHDDAQALGFLQLGSGEANVAGYNKRAEFRVDLDPFTTSWWLIYQDWQLFGSHRRLNVQPGVVFDRGSGTIEGGWVTASLERPMYSRLIRWDYKVRMTVQQAVVRQLGDSYTIEDYAYGTGEEAELLPRQFLYRGIDLALRYYRTFGSSIKHRFGVGTGERLSDFTLVENLSASQDALEAFTDDVLPRDERAWLLIGTYSFFGTDFADIYDYQKFQETERLRTGPELGVLATWAPPVPWSRTPFLSGRQWAGWTGVPGGTSVVQAQLAFEERFESEMTDLFADFTLHLATPVVGGLFRVHGAVGLSFSPWNEGNRRLTLGGNTGLRGLTPNALEGDSLVRFSIELRSRSTRVMLPGLEALDLYLGGILFYDAGDAWYAGMAHVFDPHHSVGVGVRLQLPALSSRVLRFDYGVLLDGQPGQIAGRAFTASFGQAF